MTKSKVSPGFAKFAAKTTTGKFDEARRAERMGSGVPFDIGQKGTGVVSAVICDETKPDSQNIRHPRIRVEIKVETPEAGRGKTLSGNGLMQTIKDGPNPEKWSKEMAFTSALGLLEKLGLPEEISQKYNEFQECIDYFDEEPRRVSWTVVDASWTDAKGNLRPQKGIEAYALIPEADIPAADEPVSEKTEGRETCLYNGVEHEIVKDHGDTLDLYSPKSGRNREGIPKARVVFND